jgi:osmoprotectant transport system permease protein
MSNFVDWLTDSANWQNSFGTPGIPAQIGSHLEYTAIAVGIAGAIAFPLGLLIGHTGRCVVLISLANAMRALPTLGLLVLFYVLIGPHIHGTGDLPYLIPTEIVLFLLAVPPILANTYAGVQNIDPAARDAARGMGMTGTQVLFRAELPNAMPLIMSGLRTATLQVVSTATVAAYVGLGGLGRFVFDGESQHDYGETVAGAVLVAALAIVLDLGLAGVQRYAVSPGLTGRVTRGARLGAVVANEGAVEAAEVSAA